MCIEYNECHYGGMYNINVTKIFVIIEIVHMNAGVSSEKEKIKESQSVTKRVTPSLDTLSGAGLRASQKPCHSEPKPTKGQTPDLISLRIWVQNDPSIHKKKKKIHCRFHTKLLFNLAF